MHEEPAHVCVCVFASAGPTVLRDGICQRRRPDVSHSDSWEVQRASRSVCSQKAPLITVLIYTKSHFLLFCSVLSYIHTRPLALFIIPGDS